MRLRTPLILFLIASLALQASPVRAEAAPVLDLSQLMARFSAIKAASAHFTERRYLHILKTPLGDSGVLIYAAPDKLQKNTLLPDPANIMIDGDTLTIEREGKTQTLSLAEYPQIGGFIEGIRATLAGDIATLQRIYDTHLEGNMDTWVLRLQPRDAAIKATVRSIFISGSGAHIKRIQTVEHDGDHTDMTITEDGP